MRYGTVGGSIWKDRLLKNMNPDAGLIDSVTDMSGKSPGKLKSLRVSFGSAGLETLVF